MAVAAMDAGTNAVSQGVATRKSGTKPTMKRPLARGRPVGAVMLSSFTAVTMPRSTYHQSPRGSRPEVREDVAGLPSTARLAAVAVEDCAVAFPDDTRMSALDA